MLFVKLAALWLFGGAFCLVLLNDILYPPKAGFWRPFLLGALLGPISALLLLLELYAQWEEGRR